MVLVARFAIVKLLSLNFATLTDLKNSSADIGSDSAGAGEPGSTPWHDGSFRARASEADRRSSIRSGADPPSRPSLERPSSPISLATTLGDRLCSSPASEASDWLPVLTGTAVRISRGRIFPLESTTARLSRESLGESRIVLHEVFPSSALSKAWSGRGRDSRAGVSPETPPSGEEGQGIDGEGGGRWLSLKTDNAGEADPSVYNCSFDDQKNAAKQKKNTPKTLSNSNLTGATGRLRTE